MPTKDYFHDVVRNALIKDGWTITNDPLTIKVDDVDLYIDFGAEKMITAQKGLQKIAVEVKSFMGNSFVFDFHIAMGQYVNYLASLESEKPGYDLYLAVPADVYATYFGRKFANNSLSKYGVKLLVYNVEQEMIVKWIN